MFDITVRKREQCPLPYTSVQPLMPVDQRFAYLARILIHFRHKAKPTEYGQKYSIRRTTPHAHTTLPPLGRSRNYSDRSDRNDPTMAAHLRSGSRPPDV